MITMLNKLTGTSLSAGNEFIDKMQEINKQIFGAKDRLRDRINEFNAELETKRPKLAIDAPKTV